MDDISNALSVKKQEINQEEEIQEIITKFANILYPLKYRYGKYLKAYNDLMQGSYSSIEDLYLFYLRWCVEIDQPFALRNCFTKWPFYHNNRDDENHDSSSKNSPITVITFGTFDVLHQGHINILEMASHLGDKLIVGVSSDYLNAQKKNRKAVFSEQQRMSIVSCLKFVDEVFLEESLEEKRSYIQHYKADIFVIGDDWKGKFDDLQDCTKVIYLPRTKGICSTDLVSTNKLA